MITCPILQQFSTRLAILQVINQTFTKDWCKFVPKNFIPDFFSIDWEDLLNIVELNVDNSTQLKLEKINLLLDTYALLKIIDNYKLKFKSKLWVTLGLQKSN